MIRRLGPDRRGTAAIEFVLVLPVMLTIFAAIIEFGRAYQVYGAVNRLASRYAIAWADCSDTPSGTCNTELSLYTPAATIRNVAPQLTNTTTLRMFEVTMSGSTASIVYAYPTGATLTSAELTLAQNTFPSSQTGVVVAVSYPHTLMFFQTLMSPFLGTSRTVSYAVAQQKS